MSADPFDTLGLPPRFDLSAASIRAAWLKRSAALHPDRVQAASDDAARAGAELNADKRALEDPERRARALLARHDGAGVDDENALPDGFLMEILEVREEMEAARDRGDSMDHYESWAEERRAEHIERLGPMFDRLEAAQDDSERRAAASEIRLELNAWRYIERMLEQLDPDWRPGRDREMEEQQ
ncbi:MAG: iron-sulfur cluster co-chaperone HscB C-terminal domain-containing protein [Planctomycetota bacterium]|nr:iron-sulfur cluster co-chaperone HscB C-terminal domain-containing protein [Planctomycetota bacterium]